MNPMSALVLNRIEHIEALQAEIAETYSEIRRMGELVHDNAWDKLARETVEARAAARNLTDDAAANIAGFGLMFEEGSDWGDDPVPITAERIWKDVEPGLREMFADDPKQIAIIEQITRLGEMTAK